MVNHFNFKFATVLMGIIGMVLGVTGIVTENVIVYCSGFVLVAVSLIGLIYMWLVK